MADHPHSDLVLKALFAFIVLGVFIHASMAVHRDLSSSFDKFLRRLTHPRTALDHWWALALMLTAAGVALGPAAFYFIELCQGVQDLLLYTRDATQIA